MITPSAIASSNNHFPIRKRSLREAATNGLFWPNLAVALKPSRMSELGLGCVETFAEAGPGP